MKKTTLLVITIVLAVLKSYAQPGYITTIAGNGTSGFSGDGGIATSAKIGQALGIFADGSGNFYIPDIDNSRIRKVNATGTITTFAGGGSSTADGIPATDANIGFYGSSAMAIDASGNLYFADNNRIRKINAAGIITTVAGDIAGGYSGDGGPATAAKLNSPVGLCLDAAGNIYIGDEDNYRIRKVNGAGIITTIAGTGTAGFSGDGGPATAAQMQSPDGICIDASGNLYFADRYNYCIRKISASGIITTIAGAGSGFSGDGGPATAARFSEPSHINMDSYGNLYIADFHNSRVRIITPAGIISTFAGGGSSSGSGIPATSASFSDVWAISIDNYNNIYIADRNHYRICRVTGAGGSMSTTDSFSVWPNKLCNGPELNVYTKSYTSGMYIKTDFGDATTDSSVVSVGYTTGGYATINHAYNTSGTYSISQVLYRSGTPIDTIVTPYNYTLCRTLPVKLFYDDNVNGIMDGSEKFMSQPSLMQVDSNGIAVARISGIGGFNYYSYAPIGTKYSFKVITPPGDMTVSSPSTGTIKDTVVTTTAYPDKYFGFICPTKTNFDFSVRPVVPVTGVNDQWGYIYVSNADCYPAGATVTLYYSPRWYFDVSCASPKAASVYGNSATWNISSLSNNDPGPTRIYYGLGAASGPKLKPGDTVHSYYSITPTSGDLNPKDNIVIRNDTVRAGCDPNAIEVSPAGCIPTGTTQLQYTIHFQNTGNDTAHNIYVMDTLPAEVDPATLRLVMASANMNIGMLKDGASTIVKFDFPMINLLDSSHHGECDGVVTYNIDLRKGLTDGTNIANHAGIFFDYNDVVMTNTINTRIGCPALQVPRIASDQEVLIYPNPANDQLTIETADTYSSCIITNSIGQLLIQKSITAAKTTMNVKQLPAGLYHVTLKGENGSKVQKFVKL